MQAHEVEKCIERKLGIGLGVAVFGRAFEKKRLIIMHSMRRLDYDEAGLLYHILTKEKRRSKMNGAMMKRDAFKTLKRDCSVLDEGRDKKTARTKRLETADWVFDSFRDKKSHAIEIIFVRISATDYSGNSAINGTETGIIAREIWISASQAVESTETQSLRKWVTVVHWV